MFVIIEKEGKFNEFLRPSGKDWDWIRSSDNTPPQEVLMDLKTARKFSKRYIFKFKNYNLTVVIRYIK